MRREGDMGLERRLRKLEDAARPEPESDHERHERRERIRKEAEDANYCDWGEECGRWPLFEITEDGDVFCTHDGRPVTDSQQILAELFYWMVVDWGGAGFVHDEEGEAFYTSDGKLALSRYVVNLQHFLRH